MSRSRPTVPVGATGSGRVIAAFGRRFLVETAEGTTIECVTRGKRGGVACGDRVAFAATGPGEGVIESVADRSSLLYRSDQFREKLIAANLTQAAVVLAPVPSWHEVLLTRCLVAAESQHLNILVILNKSDLGEPFARALAALALYERLGYTVVPLCAKRDVEPLRRHLHRQVTVLVGQSGMGKSSIVNALTPEAAAETAEVSSALDSGRHTTTHARLYHLDGESALIDSPGMQEFGLKHVPAREIPHAFPEMRPFIGRCRFHNCRHLHEPGCAVQQAVAGGAVDERRYAQYRALLAQA